MSALAAPSIFTESEMESLPVRPVKTDRIFGILDIPSLSAANIKSRIERFVHHDDGADSAKNDVGLNKTRTASDATDSADTKLRQLLQFPRGAPEPLFFTSTFAPLQEWEGYVTTIGPNSIHADLIDVTANEKKISQTAEIPLEELSENDQQKMQLGSIFRWSIGYQRTPRGTKMRVSNVVFRDLPRWTLKDLKEAKEKASSLQDYFRSERPEFPGDVEAAQK